MKIAVYGRKIEERFRVFIDEFFHTLKNYHFDILLHEDFYNCLKKNSGTVPIPEKLFNKYEDIKNDADFMVSIGGDGTFLDTISIVKDSNIPVIGINTGKLGFLASISQDNMKAAIDSLYHGKYTIEKRSVIEMQTSKDVFGKFNYALNDVTIQKKSSEMITVHVYIDDKYLNTYWSDGLIVATPTGSTAYSLSVGGPVVLPNASNFIISPISPHNLTMRPLVIPDDTQLVLKPEGRCDKYLLSMDHRSAVIDRSTQISLKKAPFHIHVLRLNDSSYYSTLRNKLMWGMDKRN
jgi:NAD+ kinase